MSTPLVSILLPVYNVEPYIERCLRSIFEQTYENLEYIIVDDASPDKSIDVVQKISAEYPHRKDNVHIIRHETNKGISASRNTLIANARGEFVSHVDPDDWLEPNAIELFVRKQQETNADIVTGHTYFHYADRIETDANKGHYNPSHRELLFNMIMEDIDIASIIRVYWAKLIRRSLYIDNGITSNETMHRDDLLPLYKLFHLANIVICADFFIYHYDRDIPGSLMANERTSFRSQLETCKIFESIADYFSDKDPLLHEAAAMRHIVLVRNRLYYLMLNNRNRKLYHKIVRILKAIDRRYWHYINWDSRFLRFVEQHYFLMRIVFPFRIWREGIYGVYHYKEKTISYADN